ncbi:acetate/propionate family kinase [Pseudomonas nunensis]|uniref:Acetate kinase n=1 Tax=Pseudomonas nunensis TaxID=2961896 RepID=A0ABY5EMQ0_9PSED|nr:acetate/propionate family kinase [Pseudomonas nunensis]MCL5225416.1 acetate/propionate family kinase [Pseudomonas nunensis]UTO16824.1 acetate/propionate family kinase [Pseudomonas nunensis]
MDSLNLTNAEPDGELASGRERLILALNSGSSSLKFGVYRVTGDRVQKLISGEAQALGTQAGRFEAINAHQQPLVGESVPMITTKHALHEVERLLEQTQSGPLDGIGHRVVHGGPALRQPCRINKQVLEQLQQVIGFAPLHTPMALSVIEETSRHFPEVAQVVCVDTGFHAQMPEVACVLALPKELREQGIQRYGFHGLSCESIVRRFGSSLPRRLIIAHLGNGASITAVRAGQSVDTSMGLTPCGGMIMSTRSGDLDPGVLIYLIRQKGLDVAAVETLVDRQSGLLGISGLSADMRSLKIASPTQADARLAIAMFCYSASKQIAAMMAVLGGIDTLVFTGGIGENDAEVRANICNGLTWTGLHLDSALNQSGSDLISTLESTCTVRVFDSREDEEIARHTWQLIP